MHNARRMIYNAPRMNINNRLTNILSASAVAICSAIEQATTNACCLGQSDTDALLMVVQWPGGTLQSFAEALSLSQPATVRLIDRLEQNGFVLRREGEKGHAIALYPTEKGKRLAAKALAARQEALNHLFANVSPKDAEALDRFATAVLTRATCSGADGDRVCRLCCENDCPNEKCPVYQQQVKDPKYKSRGWI